MFSRRVKSIVKRRGKINYRTRQSNLTKGNPSVLCHRRMRGAVAILPAGRSSNYAQPVLCGWEDHWLARRPSYPPQNMRMQTTRTMPPMVA